MKLTFFEKDLFDRDAYEKPTISINSQDTNQRELVKKITTPLSEGSFVSGEKNKKIRTIRIPAEYLDFFVDGSKSTGSFKHIKLTSGEPEIVSRTTAPQVTKSINVSFDVNANLRALAEEQQTAQVQIRQLTYEPFLVFKLGRFVTIEFAKGFSDALSSIRQYTSATASRVVSVYQAFRDFISSRNTSGFFNREVGTTLFNNTTPADALPKQILAKEETTQLTPTVHTVTATHRYPGLLGTYSEQQHWRVSGAIKNTFSVRDYCLRGGPANADIIMPVRQTAQYEGLTAEWVSVDDDGNVTNRGNAVSQQLQNLIPRTLTFRDFQVTINSSFQDMDVTRTGSLGEEFRYHYWVYSATAVITINGFNNFFGLLRDGQSVGGFNTQVGTYGGDNFSYTWSLPSIIPEPGIYSYGNPGLFNPDNIFGRAGDTYSATPRTAVTLETPNPSGTFAKASRYISRTNITPSPYGIAYFSQPSGQPVAIDTSASKITKAILDDRLREDATGMLSEFAISANSDLRPDNQALFGSVESSQFREQITPERYVPAIKASDFTSPTGKVTPQDLGLADNSVSINNELQRNVNTSVITPVNNSVSPVIETGGQIGHKTYYYRILRALNLQGVPLLTQVNETSGTQPGTNELRTLFPVDIGSVGNNSYQIVNIDFTNNEVYISKNNGASGIEDRELLALSVEDEDGRVREIPLVPTTGGVRAVLRHGTYNNLPVSIYENRQITNYFRPMFMQSISSHLITFNGVSVPLLTALALTGHTISQFRSLFSTQTRRLRFLIVGGVGSEETTSQDLLDNVNKSFPHIRLNNILYNTEENRIYLVLARGENSPVPDKSYFSSVKINRRSFNFSSSRYNAYTNPETSPYGSKVAEYSWSYPTNLLGTEQTIPIQFRKSGTSTTNAIDISRLVRKATVNTKDKKEYTEIINNLFVKDIGFTSTSFYIEFSGDIPTNRFQSIALKSQDNNEYITRQLLTTDATVTEDSGKTKFTWNDKPEFAILSYNKQYTIEMISGANAKEKRLFIPIQSKDNFHFVNNYKQTSGNISFNLQRSTFTDNLSKSFVAMALLKESDSSNISGGWYNSNRFIYDTDRKTFTLANSDIIDSPATGTKVLLSFQIHDRDLTEITLLKLTDIFFDTIICLDTNINDLNLLDNNGNPLAHPSDYETIKEVTEDGLRHIFLKLKQPITTKELKLLVRRTSDDANEIRINRMLVLKSIGCFSQYPEVTVNTNQSKTDESSAINTSHITSKPLSINYTLAFPPLTKEKDLSLAQDLFTRASEYNEFLIWVSGGDIAPKIKNLIGYRFIDIVKSLATNDFSVHYVDGRFSSGVDFTIETKQTARINI